MKFSRKAKGFSQMGISGRLLTIIFTVTASLSSQQAAATDDEYLKMLEQEAKELEVDKSGQLERNETSEEDSAVNVMNIKLKSGETLENGVMPPGLSHDEFVGLLKENFYGSYVFYQKLDSNDQQTVYYHYSESKPAYLDAIRQDILDLLKNR